MQITRKQSNEKWIKNVKLKADSTEMQFQEKDCFPEHQFAQEQCKSFKQRQNETVFGQKLKQTQLKQIKKFQWGQTKQLKHGKSRLFGIQHVKSGLVGRKENAFKLIVKDAVTGSVKN
jgi:hypothetical protein